MRAIIIVSHFILSPNRNYDFPLIHYVVLLINGLSIENLFYKDKFNVQQ